MDRCLADARPLRVIVAQMGARHNYAVARMLYASSALTALYTDFCSVRMTRYLPKASSSTALSRALGKLHRRTVRGVPSHLICSTPWVNLGGCLTAAAGDPSLRYRREDELFGRAMLRWGLQDATLIYAMFGNGQAFLEHAKARGVKVVAEIFATPTAHRIEHAERRQFPDWEPPMDSDHAALEEKVRQVLDVADVVICPSSAVVEGLRAFPRFDERRARIVHYGPGAHFPTANRPVEKRVLFVGAARLRKGIHYLARAAAVLRQGGAGYDFRVAGTVTERVRKHPEAESLNFLGHLPGARVREELLLADVFVLPTLAEGSAVAVFEALAAGVPVITTRSAGSVVDDGVEGFIVPDRDSEALANAIVTIVENRSLRDKMARAARTRSAEYDEERWGGRLLAVLQAV